MVPDTHPPAGRITCIPGSFMTHSGKETENNFFFSEGLSHAMSGILSHPLTLVEAPMGYGKTTAAREHLLIQGVPQYWARVYDSSLSAFWASFCLMFRSFGEGFSERMLQQQFPGDSFSRASLVSLLERADLPEEAVFVIDDYHLAACVETDDLFAFLARVNIPGMHFVLNTRYAEFPSLAELKLKGHLHHIEKNAFELTATDIQQYFRLNGAGVRREEADRLQSWSEGWISALYLLLLHYRKDGHFETTTHIDRLIEMSVYEPLPDDTKRILRQLAFFDRFTGEQAVFVTEDPRASEQLLSLARRNAFVQYDKKTGTFQIHNLLTNFLTELPEMNGETGRLTLYKRAGAWFQRQGSFLQAMKYQYMAGDFEGLLDSLERDKGASLLAEHRSQLIRYAADCPADVRRRHPIACLVYAISLMTYNEMDLFMCACDDYRAMLEEPMSDPVEHDWLEGEFELLLSFSAYNDIRAMTEHNRRAGTLMKGPSRFLDTHGSMTFGAPSLLYLFHRETGGLEESVRALTEGMPFYGRLTDGHGKGAESVMCAEMHYQRGEFDDAQVMLYKALYDASTHAQAEIVLCAQFLQARIALAKGDFPGMSAFLDTMTLSLEKAGAFTLLNTADMCKGYLLGCLRQTTGIADWLSDLHAGPNRLLFQALAFFHLVHGRLLLLKGEPLMLLGLTDLFTETASVFPSRLALVQTKLYEAAANMLAFRHAAALEALTEAIVMAEPDRLYMPFVENGDYLASMLQELQGMGIHRHAISQILALHVPYRASLDAITREFFTDKRPGLTGRELEIARLAAEGLSNKEIGARLFISPNTVKTLMKNVFDKLGISSRALLAQNLEEAP